MGLDAQIFFRLKDGHQAPKFPPIFGFTWKVAPADPDLSPPGSTHKIHTLCRYYGPGYERGLWPALCAILMLLHADESIERVWYGDDGDDECALPECPPERVLELSAHYMKHGHRPYEAKY